MPRINASKCTSARLKTIKGRNLRINKRYFFTDERVSFHIHKMCCTYLCLLRLTCPVIWVKWLANWIAMDKVSKIKKSMFLCFKILLRVLLDIYYISKIRIIYIETCVVRHKCLNFRNTYSINETCFDNPVWKCLSGVLNVNGEDDDDC